MANYYARATGNVNGVIWATTPTGTASDLFSSFTSADTLYSNNFSVTVNVNTTVGEVRNDNTNGATAGGGFTLNNSITLIANCFSGTSSSPCVTFAGASPNFANIVGNIAAGNASGGIPAGAFNSSTGILNIIGNVLGGSGSTGNNGVNNFSTGTVNITGNVTGGVAASNFGVQNNNVGIMNIIGSAIGGPSAAGANNNSTGTIFVTKAVGNGFGLGSAGIGAVQVGLANSQNGRAYVEQVEFGPRGATPISGPVYILPSNRNTLTGYTTALGTPVTFYNSLSVSGLLPPVSSVQAGVVYNVGNSVGTMAVPSASAVQFGVPVDNTVGTAALQPQDVWGYARLSATQVDSMGDRLRNTATTQSIGYQIASFNL